MVTAVLSGLLRGLQEFLLAPRGLWRMHQQILTSSQRSRRDALWMSSSSTGGGAERVNEQALRRQKLLEATSGVGSQERHGSLIFSQSSSTPNESDSVDSNASSNYNNSRGSEEGIIKLFGHIWFFNFLLVFVMWFVFTSLSLISHGSFCRWFSKIYIINIIHNLVVFVLQNCIFLVMELVNVIYLRKICEKIYALQQRKKRLRDSLSGEPSQFSRRSNVPGSPARERSQPRKSHQPGPYTHAGEKNIDRGSKIASTSVASTPVTSTPSPPYRIGKSLMDRVYSIVFFIVFRLQWKLITTFITNFWVNFVINSMSEAYMYTCYAFEYYARHTSDTTFDMLLLQIITYWPFFVGYGLTLGLSSSFLPGLDDLLIAFTYPVLVVGAFQVPWSRFLVARYRVPNWTRSLLILSMRPALITTNALISLFARVGCSLCSITVNAATASSLSMPKRPPLHSKQQ